MATPHLNRRDIFKATAAGLIATGGICAVEAAPDTPRSPNQRLGIGAIGLRYQGTVITLVAAELRPGRGAVRRRPQRARTGPGQLRQHAQDS